MEVPVEALWFKAYLERIEELDERIAVGQAIEAMAALPGWAAVATMIEEYRQQSLADPLTVGKVLEHAQYADLFGRVTAMTAVLAVPEVASVVTQQADAELRRIVAAREGQDVE